MNGINNHIVMLELARHKHQQLLKEAKEAKLAREADRNRRLLRTNSPKGFSRPAAPPRRENSSRSFLRLALFLLLITLATILVIQTLPAGVLPV